MKVFKESFEIDKKELERLKNIKVDPEIIEKIREELKSDLKAYFNMDVSLIVNVNNYYDSRAEIIDNYISSLESLYDIALMAVVSLKNSKLGNRILVFNTAGYFNCSGLHKGWCNCTKYCYAGRLEFRQFKKTVRNTIFFLYCKYSVQAELFDLLEIGIKMATNKELQEVNTVLYELKAIRFNEAGEIRDSIDLNMLNRVVRIFKRAGCNIKAYTYTTNPEIWTNSSSNIVINKSLGFNLKPLDKEIKRAENLKKYTSPLDIDQVKAVNNSYTLIIERPEEIEGIYKKYGAYKSVNICTGNCRTCRKCSLLNNIVVFILHGNKSKERLQAEIKEASEILERCREGGF